MYINITDSETGSNKGSSAALVRYLEKENQLQDRKDQQPEFWFNGGLVPDVQLIMPQQVRINIDNNIAKLGKNDAKFFLVNISPSEKEILWLKEIFGDREAEEKLKGFAIKVMDAYAQNFKRSGIESNRDLLWYGKLEHYRYFKHDDPEVKDGLAKQGDRKPGEQMHVQIIVSRKDITNRIKLSPMNNSRGKNAAHSDKLGQFDRKAFKAAGENIFDQLFAYNRSIKDTMNYALTMKIGNAEEKRALYQLEQQSQSEQIAPILPNDGTVSISQGEDSMQELTGFVNSLGLAGLLADLLAGHNLTAEDNDIVPELRKEKKKRKPRL